MVAESVPGSHSDTMGPQTEDTGQLASAPVVYPRSHGTRSPLKPEGHTPSGGAAFSVPWEALVLLPGSLPLPMPFCLLTMYIPGHHLIIHFHQTIGVTAPRPVGEGEDQEGCWKVSHSGSPNPYLRPGEAEAQRGDGGLPWVTQQVLQRGKTLRNIDRLCHHGSGHSPTAHRQYKPGPSGSGAALSLCDSNPPQRGLKGLRGVEERDHKLP